LNVITFGCFENGFGHIVMHHEFCWDYP
jgi:hypothetical protein